MKKEKTVKTYQRRTKTGKIVTVKQHTAKYDAAEAMKEAAKKKGAGEELESLKKKPQTKPAKEVAPKDDALGFTAEEFKAWYHWDTDADPKNASAKKVEKALKAKLGAKGYKKYYDEMTDSYSSRGHNKAFKGLGEQFTEKKELAKAPNKDAKAPKSKIREDLPEMRHGGDYKKDAGSHAVATTQLKKEGFKLGKDNLFHHEDGRTAYIDTKSGKWMIKEAKASKESKAGKGPVGREYEGPATLQTYKGDLTKASVRKMEGGKGYHITSSEGYSLARFSTKAAADKALASRTFDDKHSAKVEEWKQNGNVRGLQKEIAKIKLQYGNDRKKAAKLIKPLEEAIAAAKSSSKKETKTPKSSKDDWKSAPKNSGKYAAGKQKEGAAKEGLHYAMDGKSRDEKPSKKVSPVTKVGKEAAAAEKNQRPVKVRQLPKANASLSRMTGTLHFDVSGKNPATVSRDEKDRSKWNVSLGVTKKTFGSQKEVFAYLRKVKKSNAQRAERASSYKNADANISMD